MFFTLLQHRDTGLGARCLPFVCLRRSVARLRPDPSRPIKGIHVCTFVRVEVPFPSWGDVLFAAKLHQLYIKHIE